MDPFVIRRPNECPICGSELILITSEITAYTIDQNGRPLNQLCGSWKQYLKCSNIQCGTRFNTVQDQYNLIIKPAYRDPVIIDRRPPINNNPFDDVTEF